MSIINKAHCKTLALETIQKTRPQFNRVSKEFLDRIEAHLRSYIIAEIHRHPSVGKTIK